MFYRQGFVFCFSVEFFIKKNARKIQEINLQRLTQIYRKNDEKPEKMVTERLMLWKNFLNGKCFKTKWEVYFKKIYMLTSFNPTVNPVYWSFNPTVNPVH